MRLNFFKTFLGKKASGVVRRVRGYLAAKSTNLNVDWSFGKTSQDREALAAISVLRDKARDHERNNDWVRGQLGYFEANVIGLGIRAQSNVTAPMDEKVKEELDREIDREFKHWSKLGNCEVSGKQSMPDFQRLAARSLQRDGETPIIRLIRGKKFGNSKVPFAFQVLEQDRLDEKFNRARTDKENAVVMGVEIDSYGRDVAYWLHENHPGGDSRFNFFRSSQRIRVSAEDIIFGFRQERAEQNRSVTPYASVMETIRHLKAFISSVIVRKRVEATIPYFIKTKEGEAPVSDVTEGVDGIQKYERVSDIENGVYYLNSDEDVVTPTIQANGADTEVIKSGFLRDASTSVGISYEGSSGDYTKTNYSSSRLSKESEKDQFEIVQQWISDHILQKIFECWLDAAYMSGVIKIPNYVGNEYQFNQPNWLSRGWNYIDPVKEIAASKEALKSCMTTHSKVLSERGMDFEETMQTIAKERKRMMELGIPCDIYSDSALFDKKFIEILKESLNEDSNKPS